jgi:DNA polymerase V
MTRLLLTSDFLEPGDTLLVDTTRKPVHNDIVVASVNGLLTVKKLHYSYMETILFPENDDYFPIILKGRDRLDIWGVARLVIKTL